VASAGASVGSASRAKPSAADAASGAGASGEGRGVEAELGSAGDAGARRRQLLDAALGVFLEFGFRKTSMDEVARTAGVSRQALYLHFARKEALFRAVVEHALDGAFRAAEERLMNAALPVRDRLTGGLDEWVGRYVGKLGGGTSGNVVTDQADPTHALVAPVMRHYRDRFVELLAKSIRSSGLLAAYKPAGLTARQLAETLYATARGFKLESTTRAEFNDAVGKAVRAFCLPLGARA
jgi:AcrR family transcriptional regulator